MVLKLIMFTIAFAAIDARWQLYWWDEFNSNQSSIDTNKWYIQNELGNCDGKILR